MDLEVLLFEAAEKGIDNLTVEKFNMLTSLCEKLPISVIHDYAKLSPQLRVGEIAYILNRFVEDKKDQGMI